MLRKQGKTISTMANIDRLIAMSNTIQHDWQYNTLMLASIKDSDHFNRSCMVYRRMQISAVVDVGNDKQTISYYYVPALKQYNTIDNAVSNIAPPKRGAIGKALDLLSNVFNKTKGLI